MQKGYNPQVADSVFLSKQIDTSAIDSSVIKAGIQDTAFISGTDSIRKPDKFISDSAVADVSALEEANLKIQFKPGSTQADYPYATIHKWNFNENFLLENPIADIKFHEHHDSLQTTIQYENQISSVTRKVSQNDGLTGLGLLIIFLFIWIRIFYGKFYTLLADSISNYQIAAKLYLEKNILTRRVSLMLNVIYFIVFAIFLYELLIYFNIPAPDIKGIYLFGIILGGLFLYSLIRIALLQITGFIFDNRSVFTEYIHHTFIFNKGLGIVLFPLIVMVFYIPTGLVKYLLVSGLTIYLVVFFLKVIRAYKIIIRKDILLFYLILYLCTLEILPLLLGYKALKSLIMIY